MERQSDVTILAKAMSTALTLVLSGCSSSGDAAPPAATCSGAPLMATEPDSVDSLYGNEGSTCGWGTGDVTFGMAAAGASCSSPTDCSPTCCPCPNDAYHSIATWCDNGTCASAEETCCMILGSNVCGNGG